jgi:DNA-binding NarL/FixJ family response regulator
MTDAAAQRRAAVVADLVAGKSLLDVALEHNISQATASRWFTESGQSRPRGRNHRSLTPEKQKTIARMLRDGFSTTEIRKRAHCNKTTVERVRAELEGKAVEHV